MAFLTTTHPWGERMRRTTIAGITIALTALLAQPAQAADPVPVDESTVAYFTSNVVVSNLDPETGATLATTTYDGSTASDDTLGTLNTKDGGFTAAASGSGGTTSASGCRRVTVNNYARNLLGSVAYNYQTYMEWCWTRSTYYTGNVLSGFRLLQVGSQQYWRGQVNYDQHFYSWVSGRPRSGAISYRQGRFENCVLKYGCISNTYPGNTIRGHSNGTWTWSTAG